MKNSTLGLLLVLSGVLLGWIVLGRQASRSTEPSLEVSAVDNEDRDEATLADVPPSALGAATKQLSPIDQRDQPQAATQSRRLGATANVEIRLVGAEGQALRRPSPQSEGELAEILVLEAGHTDYERHQAEFDSEGVAHFQFPGGLRLEWVRAEGPKWSAGSSAFRKLRARIAADERYKVSLRVGFGVTAGGRVVDCAGSPVPDVEVCAYVGGKGLVDWSNPLANWAEPHYRTRSDAEGNFVLRGLPNREVCICVRPQQWLQVRPDLLAKGTTGGVYVFFRGSTPKDLELVVVPRESLAIRVADIAGRPAAHSILEFEPLGFAAHNLVSAPLEPERRSVIDPATGRPEIISAKQEPVTWPYHVEPEHADENGRLTFVGSAGTWQVSARSRYCDKQESIVSTFEVPRRAALLLSVPGVLSTLNGHVLLEHDGTPVYDAEVQFGLQDSPDVVYTDSDGHFTIEGADVAGGYDLTVVGEGFFPITEHFPPAELEPELRMRAAAELEAQLLDPTGAVLSGKQMVLVRRLGGAGDLPDSAARNWLRSQATPIQAALTDGAGRLQFEQLYPGEYEVAFMRPTDIGKLDDWNRPIVQPRAWKTWTISTEGGPHELLLDLEGYEPLELTRYAQLSGKLTDAQSGAPIGNAQLEIVWRGLSRPLQTSPEGAYALAIPTGRAVLEIRCPGYEPWIHRNTAYSGDQPVWHNVVLTRTQ